MKDGRVLCAFLFDFGMDFPESGQVMYFRYFALSEMTHFMKLFYLQAPCDNGSKIQNYILQWDEVFVSSNFKCRLSDIITCSMRGSCSVCQH